MFKKLTRNLIGFNMSLLALVFVAIFAVTAGLMIISENRQTDGMLTHALSDNFQLRRPPVMMGMTTGMPTRPSMCSTPSPSGRRFSTRARLTRMCSISTARILSLIHI